MSIAERTNKAWATIYETSTTNGIANGDDSMSSILEENTVAITLIKMAKYNHTLMA